MGETVTEFHGFSGSKIYLMRGQHGLFVRKIGNIERNFERLTALGQKGFSVPKIYNYNGTYLDIEYLHGLDIGHYLTWNGIDDLQKFIFNQLSQFSNSVINNDYTTVYNSKLQWIDRRTDLPFTREELVDRLPKILPRSEYHGDMTLENILNVNGQFYLIDPVTIEYDSYVFDIAKMRQDLDCRWFLRNNELKIDTKLQNISDNLKEKYPMAFDNSLLILMLLRVLAHAEVGSKEYFFLKECIERLWK